MVTTVDSVVKYIVQLLVSESNISPMLSVAQIL